MSSCCASAARLARGASAPPSRRRRAPRPCAPRPRGRRSGRSRSPPSHDAPDAICPSRRPVAAKLLAVRARRRRARRRSAPGDPRRPSSSRQEAVERIVVSGPAGGVQAGTAAERVDLEPGVLAEHPLAGRVADLAAEARLRARVLVVRRARPRADSPARRAARCRPARQRRPELAELVRVARAQPRYELQRTARTSSSSASRAERRRERRSGNAARSTTSSPSRERSSWKRLDLDAELLDRGQHRLRARAARQLDLERSLLRPGAQEQAVGEDPQRPEADEHDGRREHRRRVVAGADGHADRGHRPERRGGRQPADREALADDRAGAEEADAGDDLRGDARRVEDDARRRSRSASRDHP